MEEFLNGTNRRKLSYSQKGKAVVNINNLPDRTIDLSDEALFLILSFLPMKDAARTSILSRRWRNLWKRRRSIRFDADEILGSCPRVTRCAGNILFKYEPSTSELFDEFVRLVDHYFEHRLGHDLRAFCLHIRERIHYRHIDRWLSMAIQMNVEKLDIDFRGADPPCPHHVFAGRNGLNFKYFSLSHGVLSINPDFYGFNSLVSLALENVLIPDNFVSYCPLLEQLTLIDCRGLTNLKIASPPENLKYVRVINSVRILEIYAKNLIRFECAGFMKTFLYPVIDMDGDFYSFRSMGFPDPKYSPTRCIFTPDPSFGGFKSLKVLILFDVTFTLSPLRYLLSNCSFVEELTFEDCSFLLNSSTLEISGLVHLQSVKVLNCSSIKKVTVCARNLKKFVFFAGSSRPLLRGSFELLDNDGDDFSPVVGKGSLLKHLHLRSSKFTFDIPNFSALEIVTLEDIYLRDEHIGDLLSNCLLLERLNLIECHGVFTLNIVGAFLQLKYLNVSHCKQLKEIGIRAANLMEFKYHGPLLCFSLREVPQLVTVEMRVEANDYDISTNHVLSMLSEDVPRLQTMIFHIEDRKVPEALPTFLNLKHLVLFFGPQPHKLTWMTLFLLASPFLEKFQVQLPCYLSGLVEKTTLPKTWIHNHLKEVVLFRFGGVKEEIKFATHLLQNVNSLRLMKIDPRPIHSSKLPLDWVQSGREKTIQLLRKETMPDVKLVVL